jgi:hypothetical protein
VTVVTSQKTFFCFLKENKNELLEKFNILNGKEEKLNNL